MAQFQKGEGGRPKGKPNKITGTLRDWLAEFIDSKRQQIEADWQALEPKDRIVMFEKLVKYVLPTLQATTIQTDFEKLSDSELDHIIKELKNATHETK